MYVDGNLRAFKNGSASHAFLQTGHIFEFTPLTTHVYALATLFQFLLKFDPGFFFRLIVFTGQFLIFDRADDLR